MAGSTALPLQQLIASLDITSLPRILQVCSGVYYQGSVYEISGSEMCFSTGDLMKVIRIELWSVCCQDISNSDKFELSINHTGLFRVVPEEMSVSKNEEVAKLRPMGLESCLPFSPSKMSCDNLTLREEGTTKRCKGVDSWMCSHVQQEASEKMHIALPYPGELSECVSKECFTLREIVSSPRLLHRRFRFLNAAKCETNLVLTPIFQVHAIMHLRKNVQFLSSLEVDVIDVTEMCKDVKFATPVCLLEVLSLPDEAFPIEVEILEGPSHSLFKCSWVQELKPGNHLLFHRTGSSEMILLSATKNQKSHQYFLVSQQYGGRFRRLPREFNSVYELYVASIQTPGLKVCITRSCDEVEEEGLPALSIGEQLEVVCCKTMELPRESNREPKQSEVLLCHHLQEPDDRDEEEEAKLEDEKVEIALPLYMQGHFLEVLPDNRKYRLTDLRKERTLPMDFKVVSRDPELASDPLVGFACLRIEGAIIEPTIQASFPHRPEHCFEIPTKWLSLSVSFTEDSLPWHNGQPPNCHVDRVTEVTDAFFHQFLKEDNSNAAPPPPPRPPKQNLSSAKSCKIKSRCSKKSSKTKHRQEKSLPTKEVASMTLNSKRRPAPPTPDTADKQPPLVSPGMFSVDEMTPDQAVQNTCLKTATLKKKPMQHNLAAQEDSDHDYEPVDVTL